MHAVAASAAAASDSLRGVLEHENAQREFQMRGGHVALSRTVALPRPSRDTRLDDGADRTPTVRLHAAHIECVNMDFDTDPDAFAQCLEHLSAHNDTLTHVAFRACALNEVHLDCIAPLAFSCAHLEALDLSDNRLGDVACSELLCSLLEANTSLRNLLLGGRENRLCNRGMARLFGAVRAHPSLRRLELEWASEAPIDGDTASALAALVRDNCVLRALPIAALVYAVAPQHRYLVLDALKINAALRVECRELLPLDVRTLFRRFRVGVFAGEHHASVDCAPSALVLSTERLSPPSTWRFLGAGKFGSAFEALLDGVRSVCVKTISHSPNDGEERGTSFFRELALVHELGGVVHEHVHRACVHAEHVLVPSAAALAELVSAHAAHFARVDECGAARALQLVAERTVWLVSRVMPRGSLEDALKGAALDEQARCDVLSGVVDGLAVLHGLDVLHRDIAARNVLLGNQNKEARLCDLGLACRTAFSWQCLCIPVHNWAPEAVVSGVYTRAADVWAVGILIVETMRGSNPLATLPLVPLLRAYRSWASRTDQPWDVSSVDGASYFSASSSTAASLSYFSAHNHSIYFPSTVAAATLPIDEPCVDDAWWAANMCVPGATPRLRALDLLVGACCRYNAAQRPTAAFVARCLACVATSPDEWQPDDEIVVESATETLVLARLHALGFAVSRWWWCAVNASVRGNECVMAALQEALVWHRGALEAAETAADDAHLDTGAACSRVAVLLTALGERDAALAMQERAVRVSEQCRGVSLRLARDLDQLAKTRMRDGEYTKARALFERSLSIHEQLVGDADVDTGTALANLALSCFQQGDYSAARVYYERALALEDKTTGVSATTLCNFAEMLRHQGDFHAALPLLERALALRESNLGAQHVEVAASLSNLAVLLYEQGKYQAARPLLERALAIKQSALGAHNSSVALTLNSLAEVMKQQGDLAAARLLLERALVINEAALGEHHSVTATCLAGLATLLRMQGDFAAARPLLERSLAARESELGAQHVDVAASLIGLANLLFQQGDLAAAQPLYERALRIQVAAFGDHHANVGACVGSLANVLKQRGELTAARSLYDRALTIREAAAGAHHPSVAIGLNNLAVVLKQQGDYAAARPLLERALAINEAALGVQHPSVAACLENLGNLLSEQGDLERAQSLYDRALVIYQVSCGDQHTAVASALCNTGRMLILRRTPAAARPLLERALVIFERAFGRAHECVAETVYNLGLVHVAAGEAEHARHLFDRALDILRPDHALAPWLCSNRARVEVDRIAARALHERALALRTRLRGAEHDETARSVHHLGVLAFADGDFVAARALLERALEVRERRLGRDHRKVGDSLRALADVCAAQGTTDEAARLRERSAVVAAAAAEKRVTL